MTGTHMHDKAYHRILTADGITIEGPVSVHWNQCGSPTAWHRLEHEEPHTIWMGGTLRLPLRHQEILPLCQDGRQDINE